MSAEVGVLSTSPQYYLSETYIGFIIGCVAIFALTALTVVLFITLRYNRCRFLRNTHSSPSKSTISMADHANFNLNDLTPAFSGGKFSNSNLYNVAVNDELCCEPERELNLMVKMANGKQKCNALRKDIRKELMDNHRNSMNCPGRQDKRCSALCS